MVELIFTCPHCNEIIIVNKKDLNCRIFRHGVYKNNHKQINPHLKKEICDFLVKNKLIYGCGKPFQIVYDNENNYNVVICDYI